MAVRGTTGKSTGRGRAVAGAVPPGTISATTRTALRRIRISSWTTSRWSVYSFASCISTGWGPGIRVSTIAFCWGTVRIGILLFSSAAWFRTTVIHHVISWWSLWTEGFWIRELRKLNNHVFIVQETFEHDLNLMTKVKWTEGSWDVMFLVDIADLVNVQTVSMSELIEMF